MSKLSFTEEIDQYELRLDRFIGTHTEESITKALRTLVIAYHHHSSPSAHPFIAEIKSGKDKTPRLTPASFKRLVNRDILYRLDQKDAKLRAAVVYKYLCGAYTGARDFKNKDEGLRSIEKGEFPSITGVENKGGDLDNYKVLGNIFTNTDATPSRYTLMLCLAILNLPEQLLEEMMVEQSDARTIPPKTSQPKAVHPTKASKRWIILPAISVSFLAFLSIGIYLYQVNKPSSTKEIKSSQLFSNTLPLRSAPLDSMSLEILKFHPLTKSIKTSREEIAVNEALVRFKLVNNTSGPIFPDHLIISLTPEPLLPQQNAISESLVTPAPTIAVISLSTTDQFLNCVLINDNDFPNIPSKSIATGEFLLRAEQISAEQLFTIKMGMLLHGNQEYDLTSNEFRLFVSP